jgi:murein L,D-transpeptidase YcbB/YkuD
MHRIGSALAVLVAGLALAWVGFRRQAAEAPVAAQAPGSDTAREPLVEPAGPADPAVAAVVAEVLDGGRHPWMRWPDLADVIADLRTLYGAEADGLFWFAGEKPYPALADAVEALNRATDHGLDPADYDAERIEAEWKRLETPAPGSAADRARLDLALTAGVLRGGRAVHLGRLDPRVLGWGWGKAVEVRKMDRVAVLREVRTSGDVAGRLQALEPTFPHYRRNQRELARYRALAAAGEPPPVPALPKGRRKVEPGAAWDGVPTMRERLRILGDLEGGSPAAADPAPAYDAATVEAVKRFQARHLLDADGVVGAATIEALNVPLARRVRQIELAMERGRWLPPLNERPAVFVNVAVFRLWASDPVRGDEPLRMKVVVGKSVDHKTPIFLDEMEYVVFRPYWNPPPSILRAEIIPRARRDPGYLTREDMEIVSSGRDDAPAHLATPENLDAVLRGRLFLRQKPGPHNSLGLAKFIFPNHDNIYMHGTPAPALFARTRRDFSHGCIRLEDPARFAEWVLRDNPGWTRERIDKAMQGERPTQVNLREHLRVVIFYDTVHVNSEGVVHFVNDIYGHDRALDQALARGYPYPEARS